MSSYIAGPLSCRRWAPVNSPWSAVKKTEVLVAQAQFVEPRQDAADLFVDQRDVAPVDRDQFAGRLDRHGVEGPVGAVVALYRRFALEGLGDRRRQLHEFGVVEVVVRRRGGGRAGAGRRSGWPGRTGPAVRRRTAPDARWRGWRGSARMSPPPAGAAGRRADCPDCRSAWCRGPDRRCGTAAGRAPPDTPGSPGGRRGCASRAGRGPRSRSRPRCGGCRRATCRSGRAGSRARAAPRGR